jgi:hypothetical protein
VEDTSSYGQSYPRSLGTMASDTRVSLTQGRYSQKPNGVRSATHASFPSLHFEAHRIERSLQQMNRAVVGVDDELAVGPVGIFVSADQKFQGEMFEHEIVGGFKFIVGKWTEDGAGFGDVLDEQFVGEVGKQRFHVGSLQDVNVFTILRIEGRIEGEDRGDRGG